MSKPKKHPKPARVRPKVGIGKAKIDAKLTISGGYVAAQTANDPTKQLATEAATLSTTRTALSGALASRVSILAAKSANEATIVVAVANHDEAANAYAQAAAKVSNGDASVLATLGVAAAATGVKGAHDNVDAPTKLTVGAGVNAGDVDLKCKRVAYAGAYLFEYKLEPSLPTDPWLPQGGIMTTHVETTVSGLAEGQLVRGRVKAVGGLPGPWSAEVVGRAK